MRASSFKPIQSLIRLATIFGSLRAAVRALPEGDRLYVRLFFVEGLNASEVATTLGKGASAVRMRKMRILERLRRALDADAEGVDPVSDRSNQR